jgi:DNA-binding NarL/FixJ family response regulator
MLEGSQSSPTVLFLVAENRLLRETLVRILTEKMDMKVAGAVAVAPALVDQLTASQAEIVLVDSSSLPSPGAHLLTNIRRALPGARVVLIGMEPDKNTFLTALREGAMGYVLKDASAAEVLRVIRAVASGEAVCPACFSQAIFGYAAQHLATVAEMTTLQAKDLTRREQQLVELVRFGLTNKEVASRLNLSEFTVKNHIHRIFGKIGVHDRMTMVERCQNNSARALENRAIRAMVPIPNKAQFAALPRRDG